MLTAGTKLGRYEIRSQLGAGGMGEVYLAQDTQLDRKVALKILPPEVAANHKRMQRFVQEAKAVSALNHPNILTIFEIGQTGSTHFIATEYIEGETLRRHLTGAMRLDEVLDLCIQIASALAASHKAGIIHRDIKPENVMLRRDGIAKVLDFGLAKLTEHSAGGPIDTRAATKALINTEPGVVVGTAQYMSPEQARGLDLDPRTDLWSLGVVLYEMVTGHKPFEGETKSHLIVSILEREPPPLTQYTGETPEALEWIVTKVLRKDREERYQTARELLIDLKSLKQRLEFDVQRERSIPSQSRVGATTPKGSEQVIAELAREPTTSTDEVTPTASTSSAEYLISEIKRHKQGVVIALIAALIVSGGLIYGLYWSATKQSQTKVITPFQNMRISRLTTNGKVTDAAISPDGKYLVHVIDDGGKQSLWVRHIVTNSNVQIVQPAEVQYQGLTFSPDGNYIYYLRLEGGNLAALYQMPVLGGSPRRLIGNVDGPPTFSPDGQRIAFVRGGPGRDSALIIANADGAGEQKVAVRKLPEFFLSTKPAWSPDGKIIAAVSAKFDADGRYVELVGVRVEDRSETPISPQKWRTTLAVGWLSDGSGLVIVGGPRGSETQVWQLSYLGGELRRITNDSNNYHGLSLTADSTALVTVQSDQTFNIWVAPNGDASVAKQITSGKYDGQAGISWTPNGKVVYQSTASGSSEIWNVNADGTEQRQLTVNTRLSLFPSVSPDGRYIVFASDRVGSRKIWRIDADGSNPRQLTSSIFDTTPSCSPDGRWIVYSSVTAGKQTMWKVSIDGGQPVQLTDKYAWGPVISPDGKLIVSLYKEDQPNSPQKFGINAFEGGAPTKILDISRTAYTQSYQWTPDGQAIAYIDTRNGVSNIWSQPLDGSPPKQLTNFTFDQILSFGWSRDGKHLACARGTVTNDVVMISNFR